jgi:hypothetical protein
MVITCDSTTLIDSLAGAVPAPQSWGGQIEKKSFGGSKLEKIIKFEAKF